MLKPIFPLIAAAILGAACTHLSVSEIKPGLTTEAEVRARFGAPAMSWTEPDGGRQLEYSGQPVGTFCYMVFVAPDGKVREIRQVFTDANFARVVPGLTQDDVRRLIGKPEEIVRFHFKPEELMWSWRIDETTEKWVYFNAYFGPDGRVLRSERLVIYKVSGPGHAQSEIDSHRRSA